MTNLTTSEARRLIDKLHHNQTKEHGISILEEKYLAALKIALTVLEQQERKIPNGKAPINIHSQSLSEAAPELFSTLKTITDNCYGVRSGFEFKWDHDTSLDGLELLNKAKELVSRIKIENDGWIEWKGDRALPPVEVDALVEVRLRGGETIKREAKYFAWSNGVGNRSYDIIAYRVIENEGREG